MLQFLVDLVVTVHIHIDGVHIVAILAKAIWRMLRQVVGW